VNEERNDPAPPIFQRHQHTFKHELNKTVTIAIINGACKPKRKNIKESGNETQTSNQSKVKTKLALMIVHLNAMSFSLI
jgi:hypothetical protein